MRIAIVGFGFMGMTHAMNILKNSQLELVGIVDRDSSSVIKKLKEDVGNFSTGELKEEDIADISVYTSLEECIADKKPEAVVVAVHTASHYPIAKLALNSGAHVFVEKPFVLNVKEGEELIELASQNNKILMVGHVVRFMPAYQKLKEWIDNKEYGKLEFLSMSRFSGLPAWGQWKERQADFGSSGGALFDLVIHDIDFAQWVCGSPDKVDAQILPGNLSNYDYVSVLWSYQDSDLKVKIDGGNTFHSSFPFRASFSVRFENASVYFSSYNPEYIVVTTDSETKNVPLDDSNDGYANEMDYFIDSAINNRHPQKCTSESALASIRLCHRHIK